MVLIDGVGRCYPDGVVALQDINLRIKRGDFIVLLGPSGCGKSTLLRIVAGLDAPNSGRLVWEHAAPLPGEIGFVFQDPTLLPWASALDNAALSLRIRKLDTSPAAHMLTRMGLEAFAGARPSQLSGGMRMRVAIARALAPKPPLLLMDEPFAALDEFTRHRLQAELLSLTGDKDTTVVFVTHSIYEAAILAKRVVIMSPQPGRVAAVHEFSAAEPDRLSSRFADRVAVLTRSVTAVHAA